MLSVSEALRVVLGHAPTLGSEEVALEASLGRVLAQDVRADIDLPPFDRSAMDGYAVRAQDVSAVPAALEVRGQVKAGEAYPQRLLPGQAVQVMTGAPVPEGADAVQQVEKTRPLDGGRVSVLEPLAVGTHIARRGSEVRAGDVVLGAGRMIDAAAMGTLATVGCARVPVGRRPAVAVLVTGDELVDVAQVPVGAQIRNSNGHAVRAQAAKAGARVTDLGVAPDEAGALAAAMERGLEGDVLVLSGGVSAGVFDLVEDVLARLGVELLFTKVAIKPGAPLVFGRRGPLLVFGLPGNPVSAQVTFDLFVRPALLRMQGALAVNRTRVAVHLEQAIVNRSGRENYLPGVVRFHDGRLLAAPVATRGSADVVAHAKANALLVLDAHRERAEKGEQAPALLLESFFLQEAMK